MDSIEQIVETGSFTSKDRLTEAIAALNQRSKYYRDQMSKNRISVEKAANEIYACNTWAKCFIEMRDSL